MKTKLKEMIANYTITKYLNKDCTIFLCGGTGKKDLFTISVEGAEGKIESEIRLGYKELKELSEQLSNLIKDLEKEYDETKQ